MCTFRWNGFSIYIHPQIFLVFVLMFMMVTLITFRSSCVITDLCGKYISGHWKGVISTWYNQKQRSMCIIYIYQHDIVKIEEVFVKYVQLFQNDLIKSSEYFALYVPLLQHYCFFFLSCNHFLHICYKIIVFSFKL